jgi:hypothetical protein
MVGNSATAVASQQSVKAYSDTKNIATQVAPTTAGNGLFTADGTAWTSVPKITNATAQASTSGTALDFGSIPAWVKRISVMFSGVSTNGTSNLLVQIGDAGGFETTGYVSTASDYNDIASSTAGFLVTRLNNAAYVSSGIVTLLKIDGTTWIASGDVANTTVAASSAGTKALSEVLSQVRVTTVNGTDAFDAGLINISYE